MFQLLSLQKCVSYWGGSSLQPLANPSVCALVPNTSLMTFWGGNSSDSPARLNYFHHIVQMLLHNCNVHTNLPRYFLKKILRTWQNLCSQLILKCSNNLAQYFLLATFEIDSFDWVYFSSHANYRSHHNTNNSMLGIITGSEGRMPTTESSIKLLLHLGFPLDDFHSRVDKAWPWIVTKICWDYGQRCLHASRTGSVFINQVIQLHIWQEVYFEFFTLMLTESFQTDWLLLL